MAQTIEIAELALFPLNTVLFPGQLLPLHIFEDRYRLMIRRCLAEDLPFGVVLIRRGEEVGEMAEPHEIGTIARIVESTHLPNGTFDLIVLGAERFRIRRLIFDQPYLRGEVEPFPMMEATDPVAASRLADQVSTRVRRYIELVAEAAGLKIEIHAMPETPEQVAYLTAVAMQIENREKQILLASPSTGSILATENALLRRENALLTWVAAHREWPAQAQLGYSGMLLPN